VIEIPFYSQTRYVKDLVC